MNIIFFERKYLILFFVLFLLFSCGNNNHRTGAYKKNHSEYFNFEDDQISWKELKHVIESIKSHNFDKNKDIAQAFSFEDYKTKKVFALDSLTASLYLKQENSINDLYFDFLNIFEKTNYQDYITKLSVYDEGSIVSNTIIIEFTWNSISMSFALKRTGDYQIYSQVIDITKSDLTFDDFVDGIDLSVGTLYSGEQTSSPDGADEAEEY